MSPFTDTNLNNQIQELFKVIGFSGIFSIEFLVTKDNELVFLEINFRHSTWGYSSTFAGANLPLIWIQSVINKKIPDLSNIPIRKEPFTAMAELNDFIENVPTRKVSLLKWLGDFFTCPCTYMYNKKDKKPIFNLFFVGFKKRIKNIYHFN